MTERFIRWQLNPRELAIVEIAWGRYTPHRIGLWLGRDGATVRRYALRMGLPDHSARIRGRLGPRGSYDGRRL
jgi:hypothetical protein